ncbi:hypothetical protein Ait01nite_019790 [Actinoplanes italicus]|uniref:Uncharacterized protein n=1 Tax=Actinoplanes italicus TaxID=113567 RepID=A0A2T0KPG5_9ACTN|nr:hypothetical protein [Actinoplanes italicus]PRX25620.1 hypothetical protein CLV67_101337 [Actinoplanes italicus]GIE28934.1 hypothetical protein Ait01nite_019790 [Actinoplanes italicus]
MSRRVRRGPRTRRATFRHRRPAAPGRFVATAAVPARPVLEEMVALPAPVASHPPTPLGGGDYPCRCWTCRQAWQPHDVRRRTWKHAFWWSVLCGSWAAVTGVVAVQGWRMLGPASICLPLILAVVLAGLVLVAVGDVKETAAGPAPDGAGPMQLGL